MHLARCLIAFCFAILLQRKKDCSAIPLIQDEQTIKGLGQLYGEFYKIFKRISPSHGPGKGLSLVSKVMEHHFPPGAVSALSSSPSLSLSSSSSFPSSSSSSPSKSSSSSSESSGLSAKTSTSPDSAFEVPGKADLRMPQLEDTLQGDDPFSGSASSVDEAIGADAENSKAKMAAWTKDWMRNNLGGFQRREQQEHQPRRHQLERQLHQQRHRLHHHQGRGRRHRRGHDAVGGNDMNSDLSNGKEFLSDKQTEASKASGDDDWSLVDRVKSLVDGKSPRPPSIERKIGGDVAESDEKKTSSILTPSKVVDKFGALQSRASSLHDSGSQNEMNDDDYSDFPDSISSSVDLHGFADGEDYDGFEKAEDYAGFENAEEFAGFADAKGIVESAGKRASASLGPIRFSGARAIASSTSEASYNQREKASLLDILANRFYRVNHQTDHVNERADHANWQTDEKRGDDGQSYEESGQKLSGSRENGDGGIVFRGKPFSAENLDHDKSEHKIAFSGEFAGDAVRHKISPGRKNLGAAFESADLARLGALLPENADIHELLKHGAVEKYDISLNPYIIESETDYVEEEEGIDGMSKEELEDDEEEYKELCVRVDKEVFCIYKRLPGELNI